MTTIDIVRMAREANELHEEQMRRAGWRKCAQGQGVTQHCGLLEEAVKAEREACADIASTCCADCAAAIRERGKT